MNVLTVLLAILGAAAVFFVVSFAVDLVKHKDELKKENVVVGFFIGLVTDFFDTLGIGSFAPTTLLFKVTKFLDTDKKNSWNIKRCAYNSSISGSILILNRGKSRRCYFILYDCSSSCRCVSRG